MPFFLALATPDTVLTVLTGEITTDALHGALLADTPSGSLSAVPGLGSLGEWSEEDLGQPPTRRLMHPDRLAIAVGYGAHWAAP